MKEFLQKKKIVDILYDAYFIGRANTLIALLPNTGKAHNRVVTLGADQTQTAPAPEADAVRIELLKFLAEGYLEQYRHYDNQRAKLAGIVVAAVAGFSIAPFSLNALLKFNASTGSSLVWINFQDMLVLMSGLALIAISGFAIQSTNKHRKRMKQAYERYKTVLRELDFPSGKKITEMHDEAGDNALKKIREESFWGERKKDGGMSRGTLWKLFPIITLTYSLFYMGVYSYFRFVNLEHGSTQTPIADDQPFDGAKPDR